MKIADAIALMTVGNGGIGRALVAELLQRRASKIYIGVRSKAALSQLSSSSDPRLVPLILDVTDGKQLEAAAAQAKDVTLVINNAGYSADKATLAADALSNARQEMDVNYFGPLRVAHAFVPALAGNGGTIVNVLSFLSLVTLPLLGTYAASKAAALSMTRSLRAELAKRGIKVIAAMPVQVDTPMGAWWDGPKVTPQDAAREIIDAVEVGADEVFPGKLSQEAARAFKADPQALQARLATVIPAE